MADESINRKALQQLRDIRKRAKELEQRLSKMEERKGKVAEVVFQRVRDDYQGQLRQIESGAAPVKRDLRSQYRGLRDRLASLETAQSESELALQEIQFRNELGEFETAVYQARCKTIEGELEQLRSQGSALQALRTELIEAFGSESELESGGESDTQSVPASEAQTAPQRAAPAQTEEPATVETPVVSERAPPAGATMVMPAGATAARAALHLPPPPEAPVAKGKTPTPPPVEEPEGDGSTHLFRPGRLVPHSSSGAGASVALGLKPMVIGSAADADLRVEGPGVEARHARISVTYAGYRLEDLGGSVGTRVNGKKIQEKMLDSEDVLQIGGHRFIFKNP